MPWINPGAPNIPPSPMQSTHPWIRCPYPRHSIQSQPPAAPPTEAVPPRTPPPPPPPDPNLTRINAVRAMVIEQDEPGRDGITTANWNTPASARKRAAALKKSVENQK